VSAPDNSRGRPFNVSLSKMKGLIQLETLVWTVLVLAATPYILYIVPQIFGADAYIVTSGSMEPRIPEGSVVYEEKTTTSELEEGDVVLFRPDNSQMEGDIVVHRIVDTKFENYTRQFKTQGDANPEPDPGWTPSYNIVGKKIMSVPYLGEVIQKSNSLPFILGMVVLPTTILLKNQVVKLLKALEQDSQKATTQPSAQEILYQLEEDD